MKFIERILLKLLSIVHKIQKRDLFPNLKKGETSILLDGTQVLFSTKKENRTYVEIGEKCLIKSTFLFETDSGHISIGNNVHIGGAFFISRNRIVIEDDVLMAWNIMVYDHNSHSIYWENRKNDNIQCYNDYLDFNGNNIVNKDWMNVVDAPIYIKSKAWIGYNVTILKGVTIGEGAVVGACSVVTKNVPAWSVVAGNPAKVVKYLK